MEMDYKFFFTTKKMKAKLFKLCPYIFQKLLCIAVVCFFSANEGYTAISRKVVGKKASKCTRQDRKVVWVFTGILHIG